MSHLSKVSTVADLNRLKYYRIHVQIGTISQLSKDNMFKQKTATGKKLETLKKEHTDLVNTYKKISLEAYNMQRTILNDIAKGDFQC